MWTDTLMRWATAAILAVSAMLLALYYVPTDYLLPAPVSTSASADDVSSLSPAAGGQQTNQRETPQIASPIDAVTVCLSLLVVCNALVAAAVFLLWRSANKLVKATIAVGARQADLLSRVVRPRTYREREDDQPRKAPRKTAYATY